MRDHPPDPEVEREAGKTSRLHIVEMDKSGNGQNRAPLRTVGRPGFSGNDRLPRGPERGAEGLSTRVKRRLVPPQAMASLAAACCAAPISSMTSSGVSNTACMPLVRSIIV